MVRMAYSAYILGYRTRTLHVAYYLVDAYTKRFDVAIDDEYSDLCFSALALSSRLV